MLTQRKLKKQLHYNPDTGIFVRIDDSTEAGFINVKFPKETTRVLTKEEIEKYNKMSVQISNQPAHKLKVG